MNKFDATYLRHILDAIERIEEYILEVREEEFRQRNLIQDGVIRQIKIIGGATKHLSDDIRENHRYIPWQDIAVMCDRLIHNYFGVELEEVWLTAKNDIPILKPQIEHILGN